jgi:hypothetical protein
VRVHSRALPQVALSFDQFLRARGQTEMQNLLAERWALASGAKPPPPLAAAA